MSLHYKHWISIRYFAMMRTWTLLVRFVGSPGRVDGVCAVQVPVQRFEDVSFGLQDVPLGVGRVCNKQEVLACGVNNSTLAAMNKQVTPTGCSLARDAIRFERKPSMMLMARKSVSGSMRKRECT